MLKRRVFTTVSAFYRMVEHSIAGSPFRESKPPKIEKTRAPAIAEKPRDSFMSVEMLADVAYG